MSVLINKLYFLMYLKTNSNIRLQKDNGQTNRLAAIQKKRQLKVCVCVLLMQLLIRPINFNYHYRLSSVCVLVFVIFCDLNEQPL